MQDITLSEDKQQNKARSPKKSANRTKDHWRANLLDAIDDSKLPPMRRTYLRALVKTASEGRQVCWLYKKTVAKKKTHVSERTIQRCLVDLISNGVLPPPKWCAVEHDEKGRMLGLPVPLRDQKAHGRGHVQMIDLSGLGAWLADFAATERTGVTYARPSKRETTCPKKGDNLSGQKGDKTITVGQESSSIRDPKEPPSSLIEYPADASDENPDDQNPEPSNDDWSDFILDSNKAYAMHLQLDEHLNPSPPAYSGPWLAKAA